MKNKENFASEILELAIKDETVAVDKYSHKVVPCDGFDCCSCMLNGEGVTCNDRRIVWAEEEYVEPSIEWGTIPVDTPILVKNCGSDIWNKRYFSRFENGKIYAWSGGCTSWSSDSENSVTEWKFAKLLEMEDIE